MARGIDTRVLWATLTGLIIVAALLAACDEEKAATTPVATSTATATTADTPTTETGPWLKMVASGETQTREGLSITLEGVGVGVAEEVLGEAGASGAELGSDWADAKAVVAVALEVHNPTAATITVPVYTNSTIVANDQQVGIDFLLSDVEVSILPGVRQEMHLVAPISRYSAEEINYVRFVLEMSVLAEQEETFDFAVSIP